MLTFKKFLESSRGAHGEYVNDTAEKAMVHAIINCYFNNLKTDENYDKVYSFIESDEFEDTYNKYYPAFQAYSEHGAKKRFGDNVPLDPKVVATIKEFKQIIPKMYKQWVKK